uniref:Uncharacterized protein n=1 Tax=Panagrolaimus sp. PS1159 TaxID=55785 RepID=A0AC35GGT2_9BILA
MFSYLTSILTGILFRLHTFFSTNLIFFQLNYNKMSLWLYDPLREMSGIQGRRHRWNPFREMAELERSLDH